MTLKTLILPNNTPLTLSYIPARIFKMGWNHLELTGDEHDKPCIVSMLEEFYMGIFLITESQFLSFPPHNNPLIHNLGDSYPAAVEWWGDVLDWIKTANEYLIQTGQLHPGGPKLMLPTNAEWEMAVRAGTDTTWFFGEDESQLIEYAWYRPDNVYKPQPVGLKKPNPYGLYDVYGNLDEWMADSSPRFLYNEINEELISPTTPVSEKDHNPPIGIRGGLYDAPASVCASSYYRFAGKYNDWGEEIGFRVILK